jgi:hypothetical protein
MASIRVRDDGMTPNLKEGYEIPYERSGYYVYDGVSDGIARYWNSLNDAKKSEIQKRARKESRDIRDLLGLLV